ncbi:MAG: ATP-dependent zinc protease [Pseudomonadota bacterium]
MNSGVVGHHLVLLGWVLFVFPVVAPATTQGEQDDDGPALAVLSDLHEPRGIAPDGFLPNPIAPRSYGYIERITLGSETPLQFKAKLDTGADTSSLDAKNIKRIRRGDKRLVRFTVVNPDSGESITIERPFVRRVRIKRHSGNHQTRNVVRMEICIGSERRSVEMSLIDRGLFEYPVLLGRSALDGIALVDSGKTLTATPTCHFPTIKAIPEESPIRLEPLITDTTQQTNLSDGAYE